ncbi:MAG: hypothetical protein V5A34_00470 [Halapricum sp.]
MDDKLTERTVSVLDTVSTWEGVVRSEGRGGPPTLRVDGRTFGRIRADAVEARFPEKLPRTAVRHGLADRETGGGWTRLGLGEDTAAHDAVGSIRDRLTVLTIRVAYLATVARDRT